MVLHIVVASQPILQAVPCVLHLAECAGLSWRKGSLAVVGIKFASPIRLLDDSAYWPARWAQTAKQTLDRVFPRHLSKHLIEKI